MFLPLFIGYVGQNRDVNFVRSQISYKKAHKGGVPIEAAQKKSFALRHEEHCGLGGGKILALHICKTTKEGGGIEKEF